MACLTFARGGPQTAFEPAQINRFLRYQIESSQAEALFLRVIANTMQFTDPYKKAVYSEPAPILDPDNPFQAMVERFDVAAKILELDPGFYEYLVTPGRVHITAIPVLMD